MVRVCLFFFPLFHHSKQAAEIGLWKPVYGLPPHMFAVSLCGGQPGNEGLLHGGENLRSSSSSPIICLSPFISPTFLACFSTITSLENVMLPCGGCCGASLFLHTWRWTIQCPRWASWVWPWDISGVHQQQNIRTATNAVSVFLFGSTSPYRVQKTRFWTDVSFWFALCSLLPSFLKSCVV